jgi:hypothetical protein
MHCGIGGWNGTEAALERAWFRRLASPGTTAKVPAEAGERAVILRPAGPA